MAGKAWTQFSWHVHRVVLEAFSAKGAEPEAVAQHLLKKLKYRPNTADTRRSLETFVRRERGIAQLLHFTHIENVPNILRYGIVPRAHLEPEPVRIVLMPVFADEYRMDGHQEKNCLSMSYPNYRMFSKKRRDKGGEWAVLKINPYVIADRYCEFTPSNAARADLVPLAGIAGAQLLFCNRQLREELKLRREDPTDPQAEVLEDSVIDPKWLLAVAVENARAQEWLARKAVEARVEPELFRPRADYKYWQEHRLEAPVNDYTEVMAYELEQDLELS